MSESSEEKKHPPSEKRLQQLRRQGDVAHSQEMRGAVSLLAGLVLVVLAGPSLISAFFKAFGASFVTHASLPDGWTAFEPVVMRIALLVLGFMCAAGLSHYVAAIVDAGGFVLSLKQLVFDLKKLNPVSNLKNKFGLSFVVDFARALVKAVFFMGAALLILTRHQHDIIWSASCGLPCVGGVALRVVEELLVAAALIQILSGLLDLRISRALHAHKNRMTESELKREQKEEYGAEEVRRNRRQMRDELMNEEGGSGERPQPALAIRGKGRVVLLSHEATEAGLPFVLAVAEEPGCGVLLSEAAAWGVPVFDSDEAIGCLAGARRGMPIPERAFSTVGALFNAAGLL